MTDRWNDSIVRWDDSAGRWDGSIYDDRKGRSGKRAACIVELHVDRCGLVYGAAPCTASIPTTGTQRCFNSFATCQDPTNYSRSSVVYRFASQRIDGMQSAGEPPTFPLLRSVDTAPVVLTPGKGLGVRASLKVVLQDMPWTDVGTDPYLSTRAYDPRAQGTLLGRMLARVRAYVNRRIDVLTGFLEDDGTYVPANFKRRTYVVTRMSGPDSAGRMTIDAVDPLRFADGEKVQWPTPSKATLQAAITNSATTVVVVDADNALAAWWTAGQRYLRCGQEIMQATAYSYSAPNATFTVTRGSMPTFYDFSRNVPDAHGAGEVVQQCWLWTAERIDTLVYFLLNDVAGIDPAYLPLADWTAAIDEGFQSWTFSTLLSQPIAVKDLLDEITKHSILIWWNERDQEVQLKGLRFQQLIGPQINDENAIIADSVGVADDTSGIVTRFLHYFGQTWPLADRTLLQSFRAIDVRADATAESGNSYGKPSILELRSRWLRVADQGVAVEISQIIIRQYSSLRRVITWEMDPKDDSFWVGSTVGVSTGYVQDFTGAPAQANYLITQAEEVWTGAGFRLRYTALEQYSLVRTGLITPDADIDPPYGAFPDYTPASNDIKNRYAFISPDTPATGPQFSDGTPAYQIV